MAAQAAIVNSPTEYEREALHAWLQKLSSQQCTMKSSVQINRRPLQFVLHPRSITDSARPTLLSFFWNKKKENQSVDIPQKAVQVTQWHM